VQAMRKAGTCRHAVFCKSLSLELKTNVVSYAAPSL